MLYRAVIKKTVKIKPSFLIIFLLFFTCLVVSISVIAITRPFLLSGHDNELLKMYPKSCAVGNRISSEPWRGDAARFGQVEVKEHRGFGGTLPSICQPDHLRRAGGTIPEAQLMRTFQWMVTWNLIDAGHEVQHLVNTDVMPRV